MDLLKAAILGVIQGLTEFLPISSSGHLILARDLLGWNLLADRHLEKLFDVALHTGTFLALVIFFWTDIVRLFSAFLASFRGGLGYDPQRKLSWAILLGAIPAGIAGVTGEKIVEEVLGAPSLIAIELIAFALLLWLADRRGRQRRGLDTAGLGDGLLVGAAQALALAPGVSRSGVTMTAALARGMTRESAARFSFLLSLPVVGGAAVYGSFGLLANSHTHHPHSMLIFLVGMAAAFVSGVLCLRYFLGYLQRHSFAPFVIYRIVFGLFLLAWFGLRR